MSSSKILETIDNSDSSEEKTPILEYDDSPVWVDACPLDARGLGNPLASSPLIQQIQSPFSPGHSPVKRLRYLHRKEKKEPKEAVNLPDKCLFDKGYNMKTVYCCLLKLQSLEKNIILNN